MSTVDDKVKNLPGASARYEVGHGKPPVGTRFVKGRSGNPGGKPKGARNKLPAMNEERLKAIVLEEAYRSIKVNDGDRQVKLSMAQAIIRALALEAVKGQPRAQALFTRMLATVEQERKEQHDQLFDLAKDYKLKWDKELQLRKNLGLAGPTPMPHADHFVLGMKKGILGPLNTEEKTALEALEKRAREEGWDLLELLMEERSRIVGGSG